MSLVAGSLCDASASLTSVEAAFEFVRAFAATVVIDGEPINEFGVWASVLVIVCANGMTSSSSSSSAIVSMTSGLLSTIDMGVVRPLFGAESVHFGREKGNKLLTNCFFCCVAEKPKIATGNGR